MINEMFTIYDGKAEAYLPPFFLHQIAMASRVFSDCINSKDHQFSKHPEDYTLFHIGSFDDNTAKITSFTAVSLGNGVELVESLLQPTYEEHISENATQRDGPPIQPGTES